MQQFTANSTRSGIRDQKLQTADLLPASARAIRVDGSGHVVHHRAFRVANARADKIDDLLFARVLERLKPGDGHADSALLPVIAGVREHGARRYVELLVAAVELTFLLL